MWSLQVLEEKMRQWLYCLRKLNRDRQRGLTTAEIIPNRPEQGEPRSILGMERQ
ncbi:hypothetical protein Sjap_021771 [Stephania japonica]|uniref:Uncharacterized protein n=1 Tax=Stephania japonica TaxID=461633 RepID=A0AAP0EN02_9MAGN